MTALRSVARLARELPTRLAAALLSTVLLPTVLSSGGLPAQGGEAAPGEERAHPRRPFCRLVENEQGGVLEVLIAEYQKGDAKLTLFGCVHVADKSFYDDMQRRFEKCDALLYELIAEPDLRPYPDMDTGDGSHWISMVQDGMGSGLGLAAQFDCLDYRPDNFVHADMTDVEWMEALDEAGKSELGELFSMNPGDVDREAEAKREEIDLVDAFRSGRGIAELRIVMARTLCSPDGVADEPTVIIHGRNERCLAVLQQQLDAGKKQLGIFYGAAHMEHMERRLLDDLGWERVRETWVPAWDCRYASFPAVEKGLRRKRYRARRDLKKLLEAVDEWCAEHAGEAPTWAKLREAAADGKLPGRKDGVDPWGREYVLRDVDGRPQVRCLGSDGEPDTDDDLFEVSVASEGGEAERGGLDELLERDRGRIKGR